MPTVFSDTAATSIGETPAGISDATDPFDAMDQLIDFLTGVTGSIPVGERWVVEKDVDIIASVEREVYLTGPGLSATDSIHVNIVVRDNGTTKQYWDFYGSTGFDDGLPIASQPGVSNVIPRLTLTNVAEMPFWFIANGRRFMCIFRAETVSVACYAGFYLPYGPPEELPFPMYIGANCAELDDSVDYTTGNYDIGNFYDGPVESSTEGCGAIRNPNGTWLPVGAFRADTAGTRPTVGPISDTWLWPMDQATGGLAQFNKRILLQQDGNYPMFPIIAYSEPSTIVYGELDGIKMTSTVGNSTESTITDGSDVYFTIQNVYRVGEVTPAFLLDDI